MGAIAPGMVTDSIGSYECLVAVVEQPTLGAPALAAGLNSYCHALGDQYITIAYFPSGLMVNWFCRAFCEAEQEAAAREGGSVYERLEAQCAPGPTGLCITPHLIGSANPHFEARATGAVVGLRQTTRRTDVYQGILEGLACELALVAELLTGSVGEFDLLRCTGGGARSRLGLQLRAALTGRTMQTMESAEAVCLGAALLAGVEAGTYSDMAQAVAAAVRIGEAVAPDEALRSAYAAQLAQYRALYPALAPLRDLEGR
jgi:xylulokinase